MSVEKLHPWQEQPYGRRATGVVEAEDRTVNVTVREPLGWSSETDATYIMTNGWTAGGNSMRTAAIAATHFGHRAVTFEYTNTGTSEALHQNVEDFVTVVEAQPGEKRSGIGLSMGGAVLAMALGRTLLESATLVAPGKFILPKYHSKLGVLQRFLEEAQEVTELSKHPSTAIYLGITSVANCLRRPNAVPAELRELLTGTVHDDVRSAKEQLNPPFIRFVALMNDKLLPPHLQLASIIGSSSDARPPLMKCFDEVLTCDGGHGRLAYDPTLAQEIFTSELRRRAASVSLAPEDTLPQAA